MRKFCLFPVRSVNLLKISGIKKSRNARHISVLTILRNLLHPACIKSQEDKK